MHIGLATYKLSFRSVWAGLISVFALNIKVYADPITGDAGAAWSTADATLVNPANGAFLDRSQGYGSFEVLRNESLFIRFPGGSPVVDTKSGLGGLASAVPPSGTIKLTPRLALGGYIIPPGIPVDVAVRKLPILVFGQTNLVDINAKGTADFFGGFTTSYRLNERFSAGIGANMRSISYSAVLTPSEGGAAIAEASGKMSDINGQVGLRFDPTPGRFGMGLAVNAFQIHQESTELDSPLFPSEDAASQSPSGGNQTVPFSQMTVGFYAGVGAVNVLGDLRYTRAIQGAETFSLTELKPKVRDVYDTVGISLGTLVQFSERVYGVGGLRYEPANIGSGSLSSATSEGTAGFGALDLAEVFVGLKSLTPYTQIAAGFQYMFLQKATSRADRASKSSAGRYYAMTVHGGIGFREASLGIDGSGEQPAAYYQKKLFVPFGLTLKM